MWGEYLKIISDLTGHSPSRGVDIDGQHLSDYAKFLVSLDEFRVGKILKSVDTLSKSSTTLRHLFFSFILTTTPTTLLKLSELSDLNIISARNDHKRVAYISGTLLQWRTAVIAALDNIEHDVEIRYIFNKALEFFNQCGFKYIFSNYSRKNLADGTFLLEYKA
jgi:hypothetical protein